jgi:WD40 repeat protein
MNVTLDPARTKLATTYEHPSRLFALATDPAAGRLYVGGDDQAVTVFERSKPAGKPIARWTGHENYVSALVFLGSGSKRRIVSASYDRHLIWWDADSGKPLRRVEAHAGWVRDLAATPDGRRLVSAGDDMLVRVWDAEDGRLIRTLAGHAPRTPQGHVTALYAVTVSPDGRYAASGDRTGEVRIWELETGKVAQALHLPVLYTYDPRQRKRSIGGIRALAFSPDGTLLAAGGIGQVGNVDGLGGPAHVEVWEWRQPRQCLAAGAQGHRAILEAVRFHPAGAWILGGGGGTDNGVFAFWKVDVLPKNPNDPVPGHRIKTDGHIHRICFNAAGTEAYTAGFRKLQVWTLGA